MNVRQTRQALKSIGNQAWERFQQGWSWWITELSELLPDRMKKTQILGRERVVVDVEGDKVTVFRREDTRNNPLHQLSLSAGCKDDGCEVHSAAPNVAQRVLDADVYIDSSQTLTKKLTLPSATQQNLRQVLTFEMSRHTPFSSEQVFYDYVITDRNRKKRTIDVEVTVVPRSVVKSVLDLLHAYGIKVVSLVAGKFDDGKLSEKDEVSGNLLPATHHSALPGVDSKLRWALAIAALSLAVLAMALPVIGKRSEMTELREKVAAAKHNAESAQDMKERFSKLLEQRRLLADKRAKVPTVVEVLAELTRIIPDNAWINRLEIQESRLKIQGEAESASSLIELIEESQMFSDANFSSPVTTNQKTEYQRFLISSKVSRESDRDE